jgi:8-oxo-dGTP pyrophosphatase MutT (NUDIX family)
MLEVYRVPSNLVVRVQQGIRPYRSESVAKKVEAIWKAERRTRGDKVFNGQVLALSSFGDGVVEAEITDYKTFVAQLRDPSLYEDLRVRTLAVSGLVTVGNEIIFGRRADHLTQDPGLWELVPSGGIDVSNSPTDQFFLELEEELGIPKSKVLSTRVFLVVEDLVRHTMDICVMAELSGSRQELESFINRHTGEYSELKWVKSQEIQSFCENLGFDKFVEVSLEILNAKDFLKRIWNRD